MKQTVLPRTDLLVSRLSFGTASLHRLLTHYRRQELLAVAVDHGFTHFDTAPLYGYGLAEREIGRFISKRGESATIATKVGLYPPNLGRSKTAVSVWARKVLGKLSPAVPGPVVDWSLEHATRSLNGSLERLKRDYVDILFLHEPVPGLVEADATLDWLRTLRQQGKIRYWGLAGNPQRFDGWIRADHDLAQVLQVRDSLRGSNPNPVIASGREFQMTYGYLRHESTHREEPVRVIRRALLRNKNGSIVVSSRKTAHIAQLAEATHTAALR